jgi:hypothetical protein
MEKELFVNMTLSSWLGQNKRIAALIDKLSDEQLQKEVAPGRNRGMYLLGHIATVSDMMLPLLDFGPALRPEFQPMFVTVPDKAVSELPSVAEIKGYWKDVNTALSAHFEKLTPDAWFDRHTSVSEEDFKKEPHRNKLSIILS